LGGEEGHYWILGQILNNFLAERESSCSDNF
jgi:hypothetical protein